MSSPVTASKTAWNDALLRLNGHLLQSWAWGEFKAKHGWEVERVAVGGGSPRAMAQVLFRRRGPVQLGYIPRGPAFAAGDSAALTELFTAIDGVCKRRRTIHLIVEPDRPLPFTGRYRSHRFVRGPEHFQPGRTVKIPLLDDEALLAQMHHKNRYNVRHAIKRGIEVRAGAADPDELRSFYSVLKETSERNEFGIHDESYYSDFMREFGDDALLMFAYNGDEIAAGLMAARFGGEAVYMYGASSTENRAHGAAFLLQFEAMRWARESGCSYYDLWGIPNEDPSIEPDADRVGGTKGDDWAGLFKFKTRFGGEIVRYPPTLERRYHPFLSLGVRRLYANRHT